MSKTTTSSAAPAVRWLVIAAVASLALFASYRFAIARGNTVLAASAPVAAANTVRSGTAAAPAPAASATGSTGGSSAACACCGGTAAQAAATVGTAGLAGGVQRISVDLSKGYYDPSEIHLKAGVPAEITFGQSSGCTGQVVSSDLGFSEDLTHGPVTVKLPALKAGTYAFSCGMHMVFGSVVVE